MMQSAEVGDELDLAVSLNRPSEWRIFAERQVCAGTVVVVVISPKNAAQMCFANDDHVIQTLSSD